MEMRIATVQNSCIMKIRKQSSGIENIRYGNIGDTLIVSDIEILTITGYGWYFITELQHMKWDDRFPPFALFAHYIS